MDHYNVDFKKEGTALRSIDFIQGDGTEIGDGINVLFTAQLTDFFIPLYFFLQMMKTRMKRTRMERQVPRKERAPRIFQEEVLLHLPPFNLLPPRR